MSQKKTSSGQSFYQINITNAPIGGVFTLYLEDPYTRVAGGQIRKSEFSFKVAAENAGSMKIKVHIPRVARHIGHIAYSQQFKLNKNLTIDLSPPGSQPLPPKTQTTQPPTQPKKQFLKNSLREKVQVKKKSLTKSNQATSKNEKPTPETKIGFWEKIKVKKKN